jgi:hypothetical protein
MIGFISTLVTIYLNHIYYSAIADLRTHWSPPGTTTKTQELKQSQMTQVDEFSMAVFYRELRTQNLELHHSAVCF